MASRGPFGPTTTTDDATVGSIAWTNPNNSQVSDQIYTTSVVDGGPGQKAIRDNSVKIVKGGSISGSEMADTTDNWSPTAEAYATYGSSVALWGLSWTPSDINSSTFGVAISAIAVNLGGISHYLKATNFGFSVPTSATISGIQVDIQKYAPSNLASIDYIRITVYYTPFSPFPSHYVV